MLVVQRSIVIGIKIGAVEATVTGLINSIFQPEITEN